MDLLILLLAYVQVSICVVYQAPCILLFIIKNCPKLHAQLHCKKAVAAFLIVSVGAFDVFKISSILPHVFF